MVPLGEDAVVSKKSRDAESTRSLKGKRISNRKANRMRSPQSLSEKLVEYGGKWSDGMRDGISTSYGREAMSV